MGLASTVHYQDVRNQEKQNLCKLPFSKKTRPVNAECKSKYCRMPGAFCNTLELMGYQNQLIIKNFINK